MEIRMYLYYIIHILSIFFVFRNRPVRTLAIFRVGVSTKPVFNLSDLNKKDDPTP